MINIIARTAADPRFTVLSRMLTAAGMVDTLGGSGPFTLFAPTDEAFGQLSKTQFERLMTRESRSVLTSLMTFHAVAGKSLRADFRAGQSIPTINGQPIHISIVDEEISVNGVPVIDTIDASNGIIYVLSAVLFPYSVEEWFL